MIPAPPRMLMEETLEENQLTSAKISKVEEELSFYNQIRNDWDLENWAADSIKFAKFKDSAYSFVLFIKNDGIFRSEARVDSNEYVCVYYHSGEFDFVEDYINRVLQGEDLVSVNVSMLQQTVLVPKYILDKQLLNEIIDEGSFTFNFKVFKNGKVIYQEVIGY